MAQLTQWRNKTEKRIALGYHYGASTKRLARVYGWRRVKVNLKWTKEVMNWPRD